MDRTYSLMLRLPGVFLSSYSYPLLAYIFYSRSFQAYLLRWCSRISGRPIDLALVHFLHNNPILYTMNCIIS